MLDWLRLIITLDQSNDDTEWLMTLDQDTKLTKEYLSELISTSSELSETVAAVAPIVTDNERQISPVRSDTLRPLHTELPEKIVYILRILW